MNIKPFTINLWKLFDKVKTAIAKENPTVNMDTAQMAINPENMIAVFSAVDTALEKERKWRIPLMTFGMDQASKNIINDLFNAIVICGFKNKEHLDLYDKENKLHQFTK